MNFNQSYPIQIINKQSKMQRRRADRNLTKGSIWTEKQKKKYLIFITANRQRIMFSKLHQQVYQKMADYINSTKTAIQCQNFHFKQRRGCSTFNQIVTKTEKEIGLEPQQYQNHLNAVQNERKKRKNYYASLQNTKSMEENVLKEFKKDFNPFEIVFKPNEIPLEKINIDQGQNKNRQFWQPKLLRSLSAKLYPANEELIEEYEQLNYEKQEVSQKQEIECKLKGSVRKKNYWTDVQLLRYLIFVMKYKNIFLNESRREKSGLFVKMAKFVQTRKPQVCKPFHSGFQKNFLSIDHLINYLQQTLDFHEEKILQEINRIEKFFKADLSKQLNALHPIKLNSFGLLLKEQNLEILKDFVKKQIKFYTNNLEIVESKMQIEQENVENSNQQFQIEIPIELNVILKEQNSNQNENLIFTENEEKVSRKRHPKQKQASDSKRYNDSQNQEIQLQRNSEQGGQEQQELKKKKKQYWSISENIKFVTYCMLNRQYMESTDLKDKHGIMVKLIYYLHTDKNLQHCYPHLSKWKSLYKNIKTTIDEEAKRFGITKQMIEERKNVCKEIKNVSLNIGMATLVIDCFPVQKVVRNEEFNEEFFLKQILQTEAYFSLYLKESENIQINQNGEHLEEKKSIMDEKFSSYSIRANIEVEVSSEMFDKLMANLRLTSGMHQVKNVGTKFQINLKTIKVKHVFKFRKL